MSPYVKTCAIFGESGAIVRSAMRNAVSNLIVKLIIKPGPTIVNHIAH